MKTNIGRNIRSLREAKGLTQEGLAEKLGFTRASISAWEHGVAPPFAKLQKLAEFFEVPVEDLTYKDVDNEVIESSAKSELANCQEILKIFQEELRFKNRMIEQLMKPNQD